MWGLAIYIIRLTSFATISVAPGAGGDVTAASNAFSEAQRAEFAEEWGRAAEYYELANDIAPSSAALRSAARTRLNDGNLGKAATHAEALLELYGDGESQQLAQEILADAREQLAHTHVSCDAPCTPGVDGRAVSNRPGVSHIVYLAPGEHTVSAGFGSRGSLQQVVVAEAAGKVELEFARPPALPEPTAKPLPPLEPVGGATVLRDDAAEPKPRSRARLSPAFFTVGVLATAGLGAATVWSGTDVLQRHDDYEASPTERGYDDGVTATQRTYVLAGVTAAVGLATVVVAVFTDWSRWRRGSKTANAPARRWTLTTGRF